MLRRTFLGAAICGVVAGQSRFSRPPDQENVRYGKFPRNVLDLWLAKAASPRPLVVYFHGGEFMSGDKSSLDPALLDLLLGAGISVGAVNLRYSLQNGPYPFTMLDGARAVQFLRYRAREWNLDPEAFGATGVLSGGGLSLWIGFHDDLGNPTQADPVLQESSRLAAVAVQNAPTTFDPREMAKIAPLSPAQISSLELFYGMSAYRQQNQASFSLFADASPVTHLSAEDPPVLLIYDQTAKPPGPDAPPGSASYAAPFGYYLKQRMAKLGIECTVAILEKPGVTPTANERILEFFQRQLL